MDRLRALGGAQKNRRGCLRLCARARRNLGLPRAALLRALLFRAQGRGRQGRSGNLAQHARPHPHQARGGAGSPRHRPPHHLSRPVEIPDRDRDARAGRHRRADGAGGGAQEEARSRRPVRSRHKAAVAVPAGTHRRGHLAERRRYPRYSAAARRTFSAPRAGVAGAGAGRRLGRRGRRRHPWLQCAAGARAGGQARPDHRRARRWLARRPLVVQRGERGPRRGGEQDPADLGGRARD